MSRPPRTPEVGKQVAGQLLHGFAIAAHGPTHQTLLKVCARGEGHQVFVLTVTYPGDAAEEARR